MLTAKAIPVIYPVGQKWRKKGFSLEVIKRAGNVLLVQVTRSGGPHKSQSYGYEVAIVKPHGPWEKTGIRFPAGEAYPRNEVWGQLAWTYLDRESALNRFNQLAKTPERASQS